MKRAVPLSKAVAASIGLSILFIVVYGGSNWIAAHRTNIGSAYFEWEKNLPFIPWLIPAYLSLDLFFIGAPFLCLTARELRGYTLRIVAAILIAGLCFLIFPLKFGFGRPEAAGVLGFVFDWFRTVDAPYNLVPSLHAALLLLVAQVYLRRLHGFGRTAAIGWFILIGLSPVLTYQHHVIDILSGFALAVYCFYFFPDRSADSVVEPTRNLRLGFYYAAGAVILGLAAAMVGGWGYLLLWPAAALAIVASGYWRSKNIYRKSDGQLPWSTRFVLAPCLLGQQLSLLYYRRQCRAWDAVMPGIWIGSKLNRREADEALRAGVTAVLDLTAEFSEDARFRNTTYRNIPILDLTAPTQRQLREAADFIANNTGQGIVYVHCKIGYSRSAAAVAAYLLISQKVGDTNEAFDLIRRVRPSVVIRPEVVNAVREFERVWESTETPWHSLKIGMPTKHTKYSKTGEAVGR